MQKRSGCDPPQYKDKQVWYVVFLVGPKEPVACQATGWSFHLLELKTTIFMLLKNEVKLYSQEM
jgi:hypothetical protein